MSRAWPFEDVTEATGPARPLDPREFVALRGLEGTAAVVIRIGLSGAQLTLVDGRGFWEKWVYPSSPEAVAAASAVGITDVHEGEYPEEVRVRMNAYRRSKEDFDRSAYPEQGSVGPVIPYPENRPRDRGAGGLREADGGRRET